MDALDLFLDKQIRERAYPWQTTLATCFLFITVLTILWSYIIINQFYTGISGYQPVKFPDWSTDVMTTGLNWITFLMGILIIWILINSTQWTCDWIDWYQNKRYFRKWGEYAN